MGERRRSLRAKSVCVRTLHLVPQGRLKVAQDDSPGFTMHYRAVPKGRLITRPRCSVVPRGTVQLAYHYPGLSSWADFQTSLRD
jgi:hypothetical protein